MKRAWLLTGPPSAGKTYIIQHAVTSLEAGGFYTEEIRECGERQGFRLVTLDGKKTILARVGFSSQHKVGKYGVDVAGLELVGISSLRRAIQEKPVIVIDEIGKMELFSEAFRQVVLEALESGKKVLGTIMLKAYPWADEIKRRPEVELVLLTRENREQVITETRNWLRDLKALKTGSFWSYTCYRACVRGKMESFKYDDPLIPKEAKIIILNASKRYFKLAEGIGKLWAIPNKGGQ